MVSTRQLCCPYRASRRKASLRTIKHGTIKALECMRHVSRIHEEQTLLLSNSTSRLAMTPRAPPRGGGTRKRSGGWSQNILGGIENCCFFAHSNVFLKYSQRFLEVPATCFGGTRSEFWVRRQRFLGVPAECLGIPNRCSCCRK